MSDFRSNLNFLRERLADTEGVLGTIETLKSLNRYETFIKNAQNLSQMLDKSEELLPDEPSFKLSQKILRIISDESINKFLDSIADIVDENDDLAALPLEELYKCEKFLNVISAATEKYRKDQRKRIGRTIPKSYSVIQSTAGIIMLKRLLNSPKRIDGVKNITVEISESSPKDVLISYKGSIEDIRFTAENFKSLFNRKVKSGAKVFSFVLKKSNEQNKPEITVFNLNDLVSVGIYNSPDSAFRGVKKVFEKIYSISVEGSVTVFKGKEKKSVGYAKSRVIGFYDVTYSQCKVSVTPMFREHTPFFTIIPDWSYKLKNDSSFMLMDYIFYLARQNTQQISETGSFSVKIESVRKHLGIVSPDETQHHTQYIMEPIDSAISEIEEAQSIMSSGDIRITPVHIQDYKNIYEYLDGNLKVEFSQEVMVYMSERAEQNRKKKLKAAV